MKFTIELNEFEVKGCKEYLKAVCDIKKPTKKDIYDYFISNLTSTLEAEAVGDYIREATITQSIKD